MDYKDKSVGGLKIVEGFLGDRRVSVLRDTGASIIGVRESLIEESQKIDGFFTLKLIDGQTFQYPLAWIDIDTPFLKGVFVAAMFKDPIADIIIGNVDQAKAFLYGNAVTRAMAKAEDNRVKSEDNDRIGLSKWMELDSDFREDQRNDSSLVRLWEKAKAGTVEDKKKGLVSFIVEEGLLYKEFERKDTPGVIERQLVIPTNRRELILEIAHSTPLAGHMSINRTRYRVYSHFFWPGVDKDIKTYIKCCDLCQRGRHPGKAGKVELGRMNIISTPFAKVAIDIIGPLQMTDRKNRFILTLVDLATRWPEAVPLPNTTTPVVIEALSAIFTRIGFPEQILSDNGSQFRSELYKEICQFFKIKIVKSTPFHAMSNGGVERFNGTLKCMLRKTAEAEPKNWDRVINALLFAYREVPNESTNISPYEMLYGRKVRGPMSILKDLFTNQQVEPEIKNVFDYLLDLKSRLAVACQIAQNNSSKRKENYKRYYDRNSKEKDIQTGDSVLLLKPQRQNKLALHWEGPYKVEKRINKFNVKIKKGNRVKILHVNRLVKYHEKNNTECTGKENSDLQLSGSASHVLYGGQGEELLHACIASLVTDQEDDNQEDEVTELPTLESTNSREHISINTELTESQREQIQTLVEKYKDIITDIPGKAKVKSFNIELTTEKPITLRPYAVPIHMRDVLDKEIENMIQMDIIEESQSPYAFPVVLVKKKDSTVRTCIDFRKLNAVTKFDAEAIPDQEDLFLQLNSAKFFTKIDLTKGFWQIPIEENSRKYTAFRVPSGHFQFKYLPFGLINSPSFFNRTIRTILKGLENVVFYFDDICVFGHDWSSHLIALEKVLSRLKEYGFTIKPSKLEIAYPKITFLGNIVGEGNIYPEPNNRDKVLNIKAPKTKKEVRCLLGIANFYSRFIPAFAEIVFPITGLLKKGTPTRVNWTPECDRALRKIQMCMTRDPILKLPDVNRPFIVQTDASDIAISCCLLQEVKGIFHPVKFLSRKLLPREQRYSVIERECLAIVWGVQRLSRYLYGAKFTIQCDHRPLAFLKSATYGNNRICRWALLLQSFNFNVEHLKGKLNVIADFLSRLTE